MIASHVVIKRFLHMRPLFPRPGFEGGSVRELRGASCVVEGFFVGGFLKEGWEVLEDGEGCFGAVVGVMLSVL